MQKALQAMAGAVGGVVEEVAVVGVVVEGGFHNS